METFNYDHELFKAVFTLEETRVTFKVLEQADAIHHVNFRNGPTGIRVASVSRPELTDDTVFIRGRWTEKHNDIADRVFNNKLSAKTYVEQALKAFDAMCSYCIEFAKEAKENPTFAQVFAYIRSKDSGDLSFFKDGGKGNITLTDNVDANIVQLLKLSRNHGSYLVGTLAQETSAGRYRSSIDIWRHYRFYDPNIKIADILNGLYRLYQKDQLYTHYCSTVQRRVFKNMIGGRVMSANQQYQDEYGLKLAQWSTKTK